MENLLQEVLDALNVKTIKEALPLIEWGKVYIEEEAKDNILPPDHTNEECAAFLSLLDGVYDSYELGTIKLKDGTWLERVAKWDDDDNWIGWELIHCNHVTPNYDGPQFEACLTH